MRLSKKIFSIGLAACMLASMATTAMASSKYVVGYGTLSGNLTSNGNFETKVSYNNDNATLLVGGVVQDIYGNNIFNQSNLYSSKGVVNHYGVWDTSIPSNAYALYGSHGVQGGTLQDPAVVYTYTRA